MSGTPTVAVVGGGSTGTGVARDLAMRGVDVVLLEQGTLTHGTTGRMHGLLHSGARYAISDPPSARDCIDENRAVRDIAGHCVEDTGGLFVQLPDDDPDYFREKREACRECGIPVEELSGREARAMEPTLTEDVERALSVPDAAVDPFRLCVANAASAEARGARVETHAEVTDLERASGRVTGLTVEYGSGPARQRRAGERETITVDHVVNATGAWTGQLGEMAGIEVAVRPSKGAMVVTNCRQVDTVINRCRPKGDADILVPHETTAILGTTDVEVEDPADYPEESWEVDLLVDELSELVPLLRESRTVRSFWGVRPLYEPPGTGTEDPTDVTRDFSLLDHAERDDLAGLTTIVGGKFTTYRLMAERVADHVCDRLGVEASCQTDEVPLPGSEDAAILDDHMERYGLRSPIAERSAERLGSRTEEVLDVDGPNPVLCECEAVTRAEVRDAMAETGTDLHGVRIRTRASMGTCQGGLCCQRLATELHPGHDVGVVDDALDDLYQERWKGERYALWGEHLSQAALNHWLHATTLARDAKPGVDEDGQLDFEAFDAGQAREPEVSRNGD